MSESSSTAAHGRVPTVSFDMGRAQEIFLAVGTSRRDKVVQAAKFLTAALVSAVVLSRMRSPGFAAYVLVSGTAIAQCLDWRSTGTGALGGRRATRIERSGLQPVVRGVQVAAGVYAIGLLLRLVTSRAGVVDTLVRGVGYTAVAGFAGWWVMDIGKGYEDLQRYVDRRA